MRTDAPGLNVTLWVWSAACGGAAGDDRAMCPSIAARRVDRCHRVLAFVPAWGSPRNSSSSPAWPCSRCSVERLGPPGAGDRGSWSVRSVVHTAAWTGAVHILGRRHPLLAAGPERARTCGTPTGVRSVRARGLALSVPVVFVLGALLMKADAAFEAVVTNLLRWTRAPSSRTCCSPPLHLARCGLPVASSAGGAPRPRRPWVHPARVIEGGWWARVVNLLFLSFMLVTAPVPLCGTEHVLATAGLDLRRVCARGFFELVTVTALTLPCSSASRSRAPGVGARAAHPPRARHRARRAAPRPRGVGDQSDAPVSDEYGWTLPRVHATALMVWICGCICGSRRRRFAAMHAFRFRRHRQRPGVAGLLTAAIPRRWWFGERAPCGRRWRASTRSMLRMGDDAIPALLDILPAVGPTLDWKSVVWSVKPIDKPGRGCVRMERPTGGNGTSPGRERGAPCRGTPSPRADSRRRPMSHGGARLLPRPRCLRSRGAALARHPCQRRGPVASSPPHGVIGAHQGPAGAPALFNLPLIGRATELSMLGQPSRPRRRDADAPHPRR